MFHEDAEIRREIKRIKSQIKRSPLLFARLGECYLRLGDTRHAEPILQQGVASFPDYATGCLILGELHFFQGYYRDAEEVLARGLEQNPEHLGLLQLLLRIKKKMERESECRQIEATLRRLDLGHLPLRLSEGESAEPPESANSSILASPSAIWKAKAIARANRTAEDQNQAEIPSEKAAAFEPEESIPEPKIELSTILPAIGSNDAAEGASNGLSLAAYISEITSTETRLSAGEPEPAPDEPECQSSLRKIATKTLGELYATQHQYEEAIEIYTKLVESDPDNGSYRTRLEELKTRLEAFAEGQKELENG